MNPNEKDYSAIDASCRLPLLALFGGAALWLIVGLGLELLAAMSFHKPDMFADCPFLTYGHAQPAANDAILYGFAIPAALGVILWIFARLSESELLLPLVPFAAANIWHVGVFIGLVAILMGDSTGHQWLEFPRGSSVLLFAAYLLIAISAFATFGARRERLLQPAHWFLLAALFWFPWIYSTANLFLVAWPVRGVTQAVIDWWFSNNLLFVWLGLVGLGVAFYLITKISGRSLQNRYYALFGFCTFILFAPWCGMPQGAPVPAWLPVTSTIASVLMAIPLLAITIVFAKTVCGVKVECKGGPYCYAKFATVVFLLSSIMYLLLAWPWFGGIAGMTWYVPAQVMLQIFGFFAIVICGGIYESLAGVMGFELSFPKFVRFQHWFFMLGVVFLVTPLIVCGVSQGLKLQDHDIAITDIALGTLNCLRISTTGLVILLLGSLLLAVNIFVMTLKWNFALIKCILTEVKAPLETGEVKS
jgi:cytochrome c oxidase cbb3-type subunit 1